MADYTKRTQDIVGSQGGGSTSQDLSAMTDVAKARQAATKQNLKAAFDPNSEQPMQTTPEYMTAAMVMQQGTPEQKLRVLQRHLADINGILASPPPGATPQTMTTYQQVAQILKQQIAQLSTGPSIADMATQGQPPVQNAAGPLPGPGMGVAGAGANNATPGVGRGGSAQ
jgi:hypothetical protein